MFLTQKKPLCSLCPLWFKKQFLFPGRWAWLIIILFILILFPNSALAVTKVVYPVNGTAVKTATITILGVTSTPEKGVALSLNGMNIPITVDSDGVFAQSLRLKKWWNVLQVDGSKIKVFFAYGGRALPENATEAYPHTAAMEGCTDCHGFDGEGGVELVEEGKELCLMCHDDPTLRKDGKPMAMIHSPISDDDDCISCHDPHQGENRTLNVEPLPELCYQCHDNVAEKKNEKQFKHIHEPVDGGYCTECHSPHASEFGKLLLLEGSELCLACHDNPTFTPGGETWLSRHPPVEKDCANCHLPHSSDFEYNLTDEVFELCSGCHDEHPAHSLDASDYIDADIRGIVSLPPDFPTTFEGMMICTGCHLPHGSHNARLLVTSKRELCGVCH